MIIHGDCLVEMKKIADKSVDLIVTDPPYLHIKGGNKGWVGTRYTFHGGQRYNDTFINTKMSDFAENEIFKFLNTAKTKLKKMNMIVFCSELQLQYYFKWINSNNLKYNLLVWDKGNRVIMNRNRYMSNFEYIIRIYESGISLKSNANNMLYCKLKGYKADNNKLHNTQKPIQLIEDLLLLNSNKKDTVLDCFAGSGTTAIACMNTNRKYILIEKEQKYIDVINNRIENHKNLFTGVK